MSEKTRTRFAPSPTGYMHVGNLRTALYAYLITKKQGGDFILRIEDTDQERYVEGATDIIYSTLIETGLHWDEGPDKGGEVGPYIQSERRALYKQYAEQLCRDGKAYYCFCTKERLEEIHEQAGGIAKYDRHCREIPYEEAKARADAGEPYVIRQKMPTEGETSFDDSVYGVITVDNTELEDQILLKSDGLPTYNFANVIDDHLMGITHVVRGSEYLVSTPKYNLLYEAFGWEPPAYIHCPPVMKDAQNKLSKRNGDASYQDLKAKGYLTGAILNYIALLGWSPGGEREKYNLDELVEAFDVKGISKSPAIFDSEKLRWLNAEYIRALSDEEFHEAALPYIKLAVGDYETDTKLIAGCLHQRCEVLGEITDQLTFIPKADEYTTEIFVNKKSKSNEETSKRMLEAAIAELEALDNWTQESVHDLLIGLAEKLEVKNGLLMWPVRVAVSGRTVTPGGAIEVLMMVGREEALRRLKIGLAKLNGEEIAETSNESKNETKSEEKTAEVEEKKISENFITQFIKEDLAEGGRCEGMKVHTRFPPEPNGCLHIGHVKALVIDYGIAEQFGGVYNLRMDDTNPTKEREEFVEAIKDDIHWLGYDWGDRYCFASAYFEQTYEYAIELINKGLAYVCELSPEQMKEMRGTHDTPATSPYRDRPIEENLDLFKRMRAGEFEDGRYTLRAKIDLASGNWNMRDPVIYRIKHATHHRTGDEWCIYPMYDFAHPIGDAIEHITHSLCSLEYEDHRPLYDWVINNVSVPSKPRQIEFARLGIDYTVLSKRKLRNLIEQGIVSGWDDPRMPTLIALRRRGYTPASIKNFCERIGVAKNPNVVQWSFLEHCLREDLNENAKRAMAVLYPVKLVITNYPEGQNETLTCENHPDNPEDVREISFSRELWIEADDFMEEPVKKYQRLYPGNLVRLKSAYIVKCTGCKKDENGNVVEVYAEYDPETKGGNAPEGVKVRGTIHWVDANCCEDAEVRLFDRLFTVPNPDAADVDYMECINPNSMEVLTGCKVESSLKNAVPGDGYQFLRLGYFCADSKDSSPEHLVFNRSVMLKDSFKPGE